MLVKDKSASISNNNSSRSSYVNQVCDNIRDVVNSSNTLSAFVVPTASNRQNSKSSLNLSQNECSRQFDSYRLPHKRRRLDSIINELSHSNGLDGLPVRSSLLNDKCLAECCANQVGDISSTTSYEAGLNASMSNSSLLITRPIAIQLASHSHFKKEFGDYRNLVGHFNHSLSYQDTYSQYIDKFENIAVNLSYDRQKEENAKISAIKRVSLIWIHIIYIMHLDTTHTFNFFYILEFIHIKA